jgi:hypothetical protein
LVVAAGTAMAEAMTTVTVEAVPPEIVSLVATPNPAPQGTMGFVSWVTRGATEVQLSRDGVVVRPWTENGAASGFTGFQLDEPRSVFKLEARNAFGMVERELEVITAPVVSIQEFSVTPSQFTGTSTVVTVRWATTNAETISLVKNGAPEPAFNGMEDGEFQVTVSQSTDFTLTISNPASMQTRTEHVGRAVDFSVQVITGPRNNLTGLDQVAVRVEKTGRAGTRAFEGTTDASGLAVLLVDDDAFPVDVTVARAEYGAVSIVGLESSPAEPIRLDLPEVQPQALAPIIGDITGKQDALGLVVVDGAFFATAQTYDPTYTAQYAYDGVAANLPLVLLAIEYDSNGLPINAAVTGTIARSGQSLLANINFPSPAVPPTVTTVHIELPGSGLFPANPLGPAEAGVFEYHDAVEHAYTFAGAATVQSTGPTSFDVTYHSYTTGFGPLQGLFRVNDGVRQLVAQIRQFGGVQPAINVGEVRRLEFPADGQALRDALFAVDATGWDVLAAHIGEGNGAAAKWRVFFPADRAFEGAKIPRLPSAVSLGDLGLSGDVSAIYLLIEMDGVAAWSEPSLDFASPRMRYQLGGGYQVNSVAGL